LTQRNSYETIQAESATGDGMEFKVRSLTASLGPLRLHVFNHGEGKQWGWEISGPYSFGNQESYGSADSREEAEAACAKAAAAHLHERVKQADAALSEARAALGALTGERT
jgi:hypothetical protein